MTEAQKLDIKRSELRAALISGDNMSAEDREAKTKELLDTESKYQTAVALEATEQAKNDPAENRMADLVGRVELRNYLDAATRGVSVTGPEAELNQELDLKTDGEVPWSAIAPIEERTDDVSNSPTNVSRTSASPLARIMQPSVASFVGIRTVQVPTGERTYPVLTGGTSADTLAKSTGSTLNTIEANAASWSTVEVSPVRATARYRWAVEDVARMGNALENSLRADLADVIRVYLDGQALLGTGTAPYVEGLITGLTKPTAPTAVVKADDIFTAATDRVDGLTAADERDVRVLIGVQSYKKISGEKTTGGDYVLPKVRERIGGLRSTAQIPNAPTSGGDQNIQVGLAYSTRAPASIVMPVWSGLRLVRDNVSDAASGVVNLTAIWLYSLAKVRESQYARLAFKVA